MPSLIRSLASQLLRSSRVLASVGCCALALGISAVDVQAEQIKLANGQFIQGEVVESDDAGVRIKLTANGGVARFLWSQLDESDRRRLQKIEDPDAGLNLEVFTTGSRLILDSGQVLEGFIERIGAVYSVKNLRYPRGYKVEESELAEPRDQSYQQNVKIDARIVHEPAKILADKDAEVRLKETTAKDFYYLARLAEHLGLYASAKDYCEQAQAAGPAANLQKAVASLQATLEELLRQEALLLAVEQAKTYAKERKFQNGLTLLDEIMQKHNPTGSIRERFESVKKEISYEYTLFIVNEWYDLIPKQIGAWLRDKENKDATYQEATTWVRTRLRNEILESIAVATEGDARNIFERFQSRLDQENNAEIYKKIKRGRRATFAETGWYQVVDGNLPIAGQNTPEQREAQNNQQQGRQPNGRRPGGGNRDGIADNAEGFQMPAANAERFQGADEKKEGEGGEGAGSEEEAIKRAIEEAIKRAAEEASRNQERRGREDERQRQTRRKDIDEDDPRWKLPASKVVPAMKDWWEKSGDLTKRKWLEAFYAYRSAEIEAFDFDYYNFKYR